MEGKAVDNETLTCNCRLSMSTVGSLAENG